MPRKAKPVPKATKIRIEKWRKANGGAGWKRAARHFGISVTEAQKLCGWTPRPRARARKTCEGCARLQADILRLKEETGARSRVKGTREEFLSQQLEEALGDLENLRGKERTGTAISVQTRTIAELREQLDDERQRLKEANGDPLADMGAEELLAEIADVIHSLPDVLLDQVAEMVAARYGKAAALLLD